MPCRDMRASQLIGEIVEHLELHLAIAMHAGARRLSAAVVSQKGIDDLTAERCALIEDVMRDAEGVAASARVLSILGGAAAPDLLLTRGIPEVECDEIGRASCRERV